MNEEVNLLVLATQYMFWVGFVGMAAATLYFLVERNSLDPEYRSVATVAALVTFVAAIHYYFIKDAVAIRVCYGNHWIPDGDSVYRLARDDTAPTCEVSTLA